MDVGLDRRAELHASLGEPVRLGIVEALTASDRSPKELGEQFGLATNLLAHHLDVLASVGLIERVSSSGDRRRRYVRLIPSALAEIASVPVRVSLRPAAAVLFVCGENSARSQLAAVLWKARTGRAATSAGTHPAAEVHPGAVRAAARAGLDLTHAFPRLLDEDDARIDLVVTVCDRAHEELDPQPSWWHWSTPDPVEAGTEAAFDAALVEIDTRISAITRKVPS